MNKIFIFIGILCIKLLYSATDIIFPIDTSINYGPAYGTRGDPSIANDDTNFLAVWADNRKDFGIYGTRINSGGKVLDPAGIRITHTETFQSKSPGIACDGALYAVVYHDNDQQSDPRIYAVRVTVSGTILDTTGIVLSSQTNCGYPSIVYGDSVFFVVWYDDADNIYGARLSSQGVALDPDGIVISTTGTSFNHTSAGFDGSNFWAVWNTPAGVRAARVTQSGTLLDTSAIPVSQKTAARDWLKPSMASGDNQGLIVWTDVQKTRKVRLVSGARVSTEGIVLDTGGISIASIDGYYSYPSVCFTGEKYFVVWGDNAIDYGVSGAYLLPDGTIHDSLQIAASGGGTPVATSAEVYTFTAWLEGNDHQNDAGIYGSRISPDATVIDTLALILSTAISAQSNPSLASNGTEYLAVWQELRIGTGHDIYGIRIDSGGTILQPGPFSIFTDNGDQNGPAVACGTNSYLVLWNNNRIHSGVSGATVSRDGTTSDSIKISDYGHSPAVVFNGTHFLVVWVHNYDFLYGALISESGTILDPGIVILNKENNQTKPYDSPAIASAGSTSLVIWSPYSEPG